MNLHVLWLSFACNTHQIFDPLGWILHQGPPPVGWGFLRGKVQWVYSWHLFLMELDWESCIQLCSLFPNQRTRIQAKYSAPNIRSWRNNCTEAGNGSVIHSFNQCFLSADRVSGILPGTEATAGNSSNMILALVETYTLSREAPPPSKVSKPIEIISTDIS